METISSIAVGFLGGIGLMAMLSARRIGQWQRELTACRMQKAALQDAIRNMRVTLSKLNNEGGGG